jgi:hypothetical protein
VEQAVEADIASMGAIPRGRSYLAQSARKLARTIDYRGDDEPASALAKAVDTLRQVMNQLTAKEASNPDDLGALGTVLGTPDSGSPAVSPALRYPPESGQANARTGHRKGRAGAR